MDSLRPQLATMSPLKLALAAQQMRSKFGVINAEPIAIIGMGCRFPGQANTPEAFWQLLRAGVDAVTEIPPDRWDMDAYYDPDPAVPGKIYTRAAGCLDQIDGFDAPFFAITPREAVSMDPQQRLVLEVSWEALEQAGIAPDSLSGSQTGVFLGICSNDYLMRLTTRDVTEIDAYMATGNHYSVNAGRISYVLGLQGPSLAVDTACSSSLVALHLACQSLRNGESTLALAGGVNLLLSPEYSINYCKANMLSADGRCHTFDASANGFVRAEGCGVVVLKRLSDAVAAGDNILALVRGSAVNQDGHSSGLTAPNGLAQQAVLRQALENGCVEPGQVHYVETHGTGTSLGDPIEVEALGSVFGEGRDAAHPLYIGSVKTNLGHLEAAAGMAGLIKVVLSLQNGEIPAHLHFNQPNPYVDWNALPLRVPTERIAWPTDAQRKIAGVSSFGFSGTNAHILIEQAPQKQTDPPRADDRAVHLLTLSAKSEAALGALVGQYQRYLAATPSASLADMCGTANRGRAHFPHRLSLTASSHEEIQQKLAAVAAAQPVAGVAQGQAETYQQHPIAFLFTGQGAQYVNMGRQLYETQPTFRATLDRCAEILQPLLGESLLDVLYPTIEQGEAQNAKIDQTAYTQPALFSLEYALATLWQSWGVQPDLLMGHSVGELVAACVAGVFSLEDGLKLIAARGRLMGALPRDGEMVALLLDEARADRAIAAHRHEVSMAAVNGPESVVISGKRETVLAIAEELAAEGVKTRRLTVSHAFHSPLMQPMLEDFRQVAAGITYHPPSLRLISNLTGKVAGAEVTTPDYWVRHVRHAVRFADGVTTLHVQGIGIFLEIGPKPVLLGMAGQTLDQMTRQQGDKVNETHPSTPSPLHPFMLPSLRQNQSDWQQMLASLGELYVRGVNIDWAGFGKDDPRRKVVLPTYPFQRQRYWFETPTTGRTPAPTRWASHPGSHPLLGDRLPLANSAETRFEAYLSATAPAYLADHRVFGRAILPAAAFLEVALAAGQAKLAAVGNPTGWTLENISIRQALLLEEEDLHILQSSARTVDPQTAAVEIYSLPQGDQADPDAAWTHHATATVRMEAGVASPPVDLAQLQRACPTAVDVQQFYRTWQEAGVGYGINFQAIRQLATGENAALGRIELADELTVSGYRLHPALLDGCLQVLLAALPSAKEAIYLPIAVDRVHFYGQPGPALWSHARLRPAVREANSQIADLHLFDADGTVRVEISGLHLQRASRRALLHSAAFADWLYTPEWRPSPLAPTPAKINPAQPWLILADDDGLGEKLAARLTAAGQRSVLAMTGPDYQALDPNRYTLDPGQPDALPRLLAASGLAESGIQGVVHLWSSAADPGATDLLPGQLRNCGSVLHLVQALTQANLAPKLWLVTRGAQPVTPDAFGQPEQATLWGLGRVIGLEHPALATTCLDLAPVGFTDANASEEAETLYQELTTPDGEDQIAYVQGVRHVARLARFVMPSVDRPKAPQQLKLSGYGQLDNLQWQPLQRRQPGPGEVEIDVRTTGLNFRDVLRALGLLQEFEQSLGIRSAQDALFGFECAGVVAQVGGDVTGYQVGDRVIALANGSLATYVTLGVDRIAPMPAGSSFAQAATLPVAMLTAYYGLHTLAHIQPGDRVLIHAAAGGVGQAAVQLAQRAGAEIFATASPGKWAFLRQMGVQHVMNSRTLEFADEVMRLTGGAGVDIVLNSLTEGFIDQSFGVLAQGGRFVEIGKIGIWAPARVAAQRPDAAYFPFDLNDLMRDNPALIQAIFRQIADWLAEGSLHPLPSTHFSGAEIGGVIDAFRHMQQAKQIGKVVISLPPHRAETATIRPDGAYLITGGLGALGLRVAQWLVAQGAKHLVLTGRRGAAGKAEAVQALTSTGATVQIIAADMGQRADVARVLAEIEQPLFGIIHAAGVVADAPLTQQSWAKFADVLAPKVQGAWHLHHLTQGMGLDFFVCFSSAAALFGNAGQANYAAANAFVDALMRQRHAQGLPGLSINWGPWAESGLAADLGPQAQARLAQQGWGMIGPDEGIELLAALLPVDAPQVAAIPLHWPAFLASGKAASPFFADFADGSVADQPRQDDFPTRLAAAVAEGADLRPLLFEHVRSTVARVLGMAASAEIAPRARLFDLGLDSLMAVELRTTLEKSLGHPLHTTLLFDYPTLEALVDYLATDVLAPSMAPASVAPPPANSAGTEKHDQDALADLSEDELADLLAQELSYLDTL